MARRCWAVIRLLGYVNQVSMNHELTLIIDLWQCNVFQSHDTHNKSEVNVVQWSKIRVWNVIEQNAACVILLLCIFNKMHPNRVWWQIYQNLIIERFIVLEKTHSNDVRSHKYLPNVKAMVVLGGLMDYVASSHSMNVVTICNDTLVHVHIIHYIITPTSGKYKCNSKKLVT